MLSITYGSILATYFLASHDERLAGEHFYTDAQTIASRIAADYGQDLATVSGVIAALSPSNNWLRNIEDTKRLVAAYSMGGYGDAKHIKVATYNANKLKALRILSGESPLAVLGGLKVRAFYSCIMGQDAVCIDGHAYSIWQGQRIPTTKTPKISAKLYAAIENDYRQATLQVNAILQASYTPAQIQAVTWIVWRRLTAGMREAKK